MMHSTMSILDDHSNQCKSYAAAVWALNDRFLTMQQGR